VADEKIRKVADEALNKLATELEAGRSQALVAYLDTASKFHHYSWGNVLLIHAQRPTATRVGSFHMWKDLHRLVKKGEKGIMIYAPIFTKQHDKQPEAPQPGQNGVKREDTFKLSGFRTAYVFDVQQTEGKPLPEFAKTAGDPRDYLDKLKGLVSKHNITLEYNQSITPAYGISHGGKIQLLPNMQPAQEFSVLAHELAHEMLHHDKSQTRQSQTHVETQAEAVAYVVSRSVGLDTNTASADYISLYNGDKKVLAESLSTIQETSSRILEELFPNQRATAEKQVTRGPIQNSERTAATAEAPSQSDGISLDR
jgi:N-terminal domain of anti-restriction factor ArdC/IrrE N-terminal-like domain